MITWLILVVGSMSISMMRGKAPGNQERNGNARKLQLVLLIVMMIPGRYILNGVVVARAFCLRFDNGNKLEEENVGEIRYIMN